MDIVTIQWSGYLNFPDGVYPNTNKPISGFFPQNDIILDSISGIDYGIDPGEISFPVSPECSFSLKNRDKSTGEQKYPFSYISELGRTVEFGGQTDEFGDLFMQIYSPILEKPLYTGFVESFGYSAHDLEINFQCSDFMRMIRSDDKFLRTYSIEDAYFYLEDHREVALDQTNTEIATKFSNFTVTPGSEFFDRQGETLNFQQFEIGDQYYFNISFDPSEDIGAYSTLNNILLSVLRGDLSDSVFNNSLYGYKLLGNTQDPYSERFGEIPNFPELIKRVFLDNWGESSDLLIGANNETETTLPPGFTESTIDADMWELSSGLQYTFLQLGEHTILSPHYIKFYIYYDEENAALRPSLFFLWRIESMHADNGNFSTVIEGDDVIVFERGRFLKDEADPQESILDDGDEISVRLHDWAHYPADENKGFLLEDGWEGIGYDITTPLATNYVYHGIFFTLTTGGRECADNDRGRIYPLSQVQEALSKYADRFSSVPGSVDIVETSRALYTEENGMCFLSDVAMYGFVDQKISDVVQNVARQMNCYVFTNEEGKIEFCRRDFFNNFDNPTFDDDFYEVLPQDLEYISGKNYGYGKKFYKIEYSDILELNNITSGDSIPLIVGRGGVVEFAASPRDLTIGNYRTTDLGVPDGITVDAVEDASEIRVLRDSITGQVNEDNYILLPQDQAQKFANSYPYPTRILPVKLDVLFNENPGFDYKGIGIGKFVFMERNGATEIYLVKEISYSPSDILSGGTSVSLKLLELNQI